MSAGVPFEEHFGILEKAAQSLGEGITWWWRVARLEVAPKEQTFHRVGKRMGDLKPVLEGRLQDVFASFSCSGGK